MATIYINVYERLSIAPSLPGRLYASRFQVEYLKGVAPDDGEAIGRNGKYRIECPDEEWREVLEILKDSGKGLVYSVVLKGESLEPVLIEAGEMNSTVEHYTTRLGNAKQLFAFWFEDEQPTQRLRLAA